MLSEEEYKEVVIQAGDVNQGEVSWSSFRERGEGPTVVVWELIRERSFRGYGRVV